MWLISALYPACIIRALSFITLLHNFFTDDVERVEHINKVIRLNDLIELDFRAAGDIRLIPTQKWAAGIALTAQIGKQAGGWLKASNKAPDALGASLQ